VHGPAQHRTRGHPGALTPRISTAFHSPPPFFFSPSLPGTPSSRTSWTAPRAAWPASWADSTPTRSALASRSTRGWMTQSRARCSCSRRAACSCPPKRTTSTMRTSKHFPLLVFVTLWQVQRRPRQVPQTPLVITVLPLRFCSRYLSLGAEMLQAAGYSDAVRLMQMAYVSPSLAVFL
jgi:hypothetical protein